MSQVRLSRIFVFKPRLDRSLYPPFPLLTSEMWNIPRPRVSTPQTVPLMRGASRFPHLFPFLHSQPHSTSHFHPICPYCASSFEPYITGPIPVPCPRYLYVFSVHSSPLAKRVPFLLFFSSLDITVHKNIIFFRHCPLKSFICNMTYNYFPFTTCFKGLHRPFFYPVDLTSTVFFRGSHFLWLS